MRAKLAGRGDVGSSSTVTRITPVHAEGSDFPGTLERRVRGETWPKATFLYPKFSKKEGNKSTNTPSAPSLTLCFSRRAGGPGEGKGGGGDPAKTPGPEERTQSGSGYCKWFNVRMGFGFISMTHSEGSPVEPPLDVFVHQVSCFSLYLRAAGFGNFTGPPFITHAGPHTVACGGLGRALCHFTAASFWRRGSNEARA
ncbi:hypothetical protein SRHO_G00075140 [Serrasalmus rhombeus]